MEFLTSLFGFVRDLFRGLQQLWAHFCMGSLLTPSSEHSTARGNSKPAEWTPEQGVLTPPVCRSLPLTPSSTMLITAKLLGMAFTALLDTGSSISLIGDEVLEQYRTKKVNLKKSDTRLQLASGTILPALAAGRLYMRIANKTRRQRFAHMSGLTDPVNATTGCQVSETVQKSLEKISSTDAQKQQLGSVLKPFSSMFTERPGKTNVLVHRVDTLDARPEHFNPRPLSVHKRHCWMQLCRT